MTTPKRRTPEEIADEWLRIGPLADADYTGLPDEVYASLLAALREAADAGRNEMLRWVVASLKEYPTGGGDREVMQEIKRISDAARREEEPKP